MKKIFLLGSVFAAAVALAAGSGESLKVSADTMAVDRVTQHVVITGHVVAVTSPLGDPGKKNTRPAPVRLMGEYAEKDGDTYHFSGPTAITTCTNDTCGLHWKLSGDVVYKDHHYVEMRDLKLYAFGVPLMWFPYWKYPLDTDYGWRVTPGYTSRWGGFLLTKYVYNLYGDFAPGSYGLYGASRFDVRTKNGVAIGQSLHWQLGDNGRGLFKVYYAWDRDADRYDHHWTSNRRWHYENWSSDVPDERYGLQFRHDWQVTEQDDVRVRAAYFSDSNFRSDFLRKAVFGSSNRFPIGIGNEVAWEHVGNAYGLGLSVSGPLNDFNGGTSRLPEFYLDIAPQSVFGLPVNYESSSRIGFLNRNYGKLGTRSTADVFHYNPGAWADYQTFRADSYHRLTLPFKVADVVSVVPRAGLRATYWDATGYDNLSGVGRAEKAGDATRTIVEGGVTFNARGVGQLSEAWQHLVEPYLDVLAQEADYSGLSSRARPYVFDSFDASRDWLDQFAGRSRQLPYSWYGVTPGIRNAFRHVEADGRLRTVFDVDAYAAVQFNDTSWTAGNRYHRLSRDPARPNYGEDAGMVMPGVAARWFVSKDTALRSRMEFDLENGNVAYADIDWRQQVSKSFSWYTTFIGRDHRVWDFSSSPYDAAAVRNEDFNWAKFGYLEVGCEHELCDAIAWGPFVRWDCHEGEIDEVGGWLDLRTDCLGFRFSLSYEKEYERIDRSRTDDDWRFGFFVYLRALGPSSGTAF